VKPLAVKAEALALVALGVNDCEIARRLGIARTTVRDWRKPRYVAKRGTDSACPRCGRTSRPIVISQYDYAELLGVYLGDGHIARLARTQRLRICLNSRYEHLVQEVEGLLQRCFPANPTRRVLLHDGAEVVLDVYSSHLLCLFPQAGPGKKHERPIRLEAWQADLVAQEPWAFLRGCVYSDGCTFINRTGRYEYLSYDFANYSADILDLFEGTCRELGLSPRRYARSIRLYRREDVARLVEHVGIKR
jgi:hypothetical protein